MENSLTDIAERAKEEIYTRYGKKFTRLFRNFLREKERDVCQFCSNEECPRVGRNLERAIHLILEGALPLASKQGKDKVDRVFQILACCVAPIDTVSFVVDALHELTDETSALVEREIIWYSGKKLRRWRKRGKGSQLPSAKAGSPLGARLW